MSTWKLKCIIVTHTHRGKEITITSLNYSWFYSGSQSITLVNKNRLNICVYIFCLCLCVDSYIYPHIHMHTIHVYAFHTCICISHTHIYIHLHMKVVLSIAMSSVHKLINVQQSPRIKRNIFYYPILANWFFMEVLFRAHFQNFKIFIFVYVIYVYISSRVWVCPHRGPFLVPFCIILQVIFWDRISHWPWRSSIYHD